jgi:hypothetical protein
MPPRAPGSPMESATFDRILELARQRKLTFFDHAYLKAEKSGILLTDLTRSLALAEVLEDYPGSWKGPSVLLLHIEPSGKPMHAVWGSGGRERAGSACNMLPARSGAVE